MLGILYIEKGSKYGTSIMNPVDKIFAILDEIVDHQEEGLSCSKIARSCCLPKSSTHRTLTALVNAGYVVCDPDTKKYHGSLKLSRLGSQVIDHINLRTIVHPYLLRLNEKTNYTCHLGIVNGKMGVYLDKIETGYYGIKLFSEIGKSFPLHCSAMGKILLAFLDPEARLPILREELISLTSKTITDRSVLERQLDKIRKSEYAVDREETTRGILCVATPIRNEKGQVLAAISVTFPSFVEKERGLGYAIESVRDCSEEISRMLREDVIVSRKITLEITGMSMQNKSGK